MEAYRPTLKYTKLRDDGKAGERSIPKAVYHNREWWCLRLAGMQRMGETAFRSQISSDQCRRVARMIFYKAAGQSSSLSRSVRPLRKGPCSRSMASLGTFGSWRSAQPRMAQLLLA